MKDQEQRLVDTFLSLIKIDSESFNEKTIQEFLTNRLKELGCKVYVDNAGKKYNTTAKGNVMGFFPGTTKSQPVVLSAHMDTVSPGKNIKPIVKKTRITSDGTTILGADDKAGIAIILEVLRTLKDQNHLYPPVEVVFTLTEESGMQGAKNLDYKKLKGREGLILDNEEVGELLVQGPAVNTIEVWVKGLAAHAGVCPEKGISALEVAAYALSQMKLGRIDKETVANFGVVQGGRVTNVVMDELYLKGEARSLNNAKLDKQTAHMKACFEKAVKHFTKKIDGKIRKPQVKFVAVQRYPAVHVPKGHPMVKAVLAAGKKQGLDIRAVASGGGCDANILSGFGFTLPNLGVGCRNCHTPAETLELNEFFKAFQITLSAVLAHRK